MSQYTEEEIDKIIGNCENLIIPEEESLEGSHSESLPKIEIKKLKTKNVILTRYLNEQSCTSDEHFERFFKESKQNRLTKSTGTNDLTEYNAIVKNEANEKPGPEDAIFINNKLRQRLIQFRKNIEATQAKIDERIKTLEQFLDDAKSNDVKDTISFKTTYNKCGMPYFKDALLYPAPENDDFKYRKNVLKEMFPFDLPSASIKWKTKEKIDLVNGIKNQMINYIKLQQSKKICKDTKTRAKMQKLRFVSHNQDLNETSISSLYETIQNDYPDFQINWNLVSFDDLQSSHTVTECMGMWYSYLKPDINREPFTEEENAVLSHLALENNYENWHEIAQQLERRTSLQTFSYFSSEFSRLLPINVRWTPEEDALLIDAIKKMTSAGTILWNRVGSMIPNRNKTQCYNRYLIMNKNINVKKGVFSAKENRILLNYVAQNGTDFKKMPQDLLPNRSIVQIKNHYNVALKHKGKVHPWTSEEDQKLMDFVKAEGTNNWKKISDLLKTHNRLSCRTRYLTISKFLSKNPKKTIKDVPSRLKTVTAVHKAMESSEKEEEEEIYFNTKVSPRLQSIGSLSIEEFKERNMLLYNLFKSSFGYSLNQPNINFDISRFLLLKSLLGVQHYGIQRKFMNAYTTSQYKKINEALASNLDTNLESEIIKISRNANFLIPLNYYTSVGLRSIAIKLHDNPTDTDKIAPFEHNVEYDKALKNFQQIFMSLFYWPAMLSKLKPVELTNMKSAFEVKYFNLSTTGGIVEVSLKRPSTSKTYDSAKKIKVYKDDSV